MNSTLEFEYRPNGAPRHQPSPKVRDFDPLVPMRAIDGLLRRHQRDGLLPQSGFLAEVFAVISQLDDVNLGLMLDCYTSREVWELCRMALDVWVPAPDPAELT